MGRPRQFTDEDRREKRRIKSAKWRAENRERAREITRSCERRRAAMQAAKDGREPGKPGPVALPDVVRKARKNERSKRAYHANVEHNRKLAADGARRRRAEKKCGTFSPQKVKLTDEQRRLVNVIMAANRRARVRSASGTYTRSDIERIYAEQNGKCAWCFEALSDNIHVDHWVPLSKGGSNGEHNITLMHDSCNCSKGAMHPLEVNHLHRLAA